MQKNTFTEGDLINLLSSRPPFLYLYQGDLEKLLEQTTQTKAYVLEGKTMQTLDDLFNEFALKLNFPSYFGCNWPAFWDCMTDLDWQPKKDSLIVIKDATLVLSKGHRLDKERLIEYLRDISIEWAIPLKTGESWDHDSVSINVVLEANRHDDLGELLEKAARRYWSPMPFIQSK